MALSTFLGSIELGLIFAILSLGLFIVFRILDLPDLTVDGSFVTGLAYTAVWSKAQNPLLGIFFGVLAGALAGIVTGILHTKLKIHAILAGILTMTGLYSINLMIMGGKPSIYFYGEKTIFTPFENKLFLAGYDMGKLLFLAVLVTLIVVVMYLCLKTQIGLSLRATGDNEAMVRSSSINTDVMKILGFTICNMLVALSGAVFTQYSAGGTTGYGVGMLVLGLASIIIGETVLPRRGMLSHLIAVVVGAIVYRFIITVAFQLGLPAESLKLFSAVIVILALSVPVVKTSLRRFKKRA